MTDQELRMLTGDTDGSKPARTLLQSHIFALPGILLLVILLIAIGILIYKKSNRSESPEDLISSDGRISIAIRIELDATGIKIN